MKTILLIRHGETVAREGAFCGSTDVELSDVGKQQSKEIVDELAKRDIQLVITTGLRRTDYCGQLATESNINHVIDTDLCEVDFGAWENMTWKEIQHTHPTLAKAWLEHPQTMRFPQGEDMMYFQQRIQKAWERILARPERRIAIVAHSGTLSYLLQQMGRRQATYLRYGEIIEL